MECIEKTRRIKENQGTGGFLHIPALSASFRSFFLLFSAYRLSSRGLLNIKKALRPVVFSTDTRPSFSFFSVPFLPSYSLRQDKKDCPKEGSERIKDSESEHVPHSHSMVATGFSEISQSTLFTPGTVEIMRSRMVQRTLYGISGTEALTASTVLTARITTAQPI